MTKHVTTPRDGGHRRLAHHRGTSERNPFRLAPAATIAAIAIVHREKICSQESKQTTRLNEAKPSKKVSTDDAGPRNTRRVIG